MCNVNGRILIPSVMCVCLYKYNASYIYIYIKSISVSQEVLRKTAKNISTVSVPPEI